MLLSKHMINNIKDQTIKGVIWNSIQKFGTTFISFISSIILARLLSPSDFGSIGLLMVFISISSVLIDGGFCSALIQKKNPTPTDYSTIFLLNIIISFILYIILFISSESISAFYKIPSLEVILKVQGITIIISSFGIIKSTQLRKNLEFNKLAKITLISTSVSSILSIILAFYGFNIWSLVLQQIIYSVINVSLLYFVNKWKPIIIISINSIKELFNFGLFIMLSNLLNSIANNIQGLIIGKNYSSNEMGYFSQAKRLEEIPSTIISSVIDQVSYPVFSQLQNNIKLLQESILKFTSSVAIITFPVISILILVSKPLILILYGPKWINSIEYFKILCFAGYAMSIQNITYFAVASVGKSKSLFYWTVIKRLLGIIGIIIGAYFWDIKGLLWGTVSSFYAIYFINGYLAEKFISLTILNQLKSIIPIILLSFISYLITYLILSIIDNNIYFKMILTIIIYFSTYYLIGKAFKLKSLNYLEDNILTFYNKYKG